MSSKRPVVNPPTARNMRQEGSVAHIVDVKPEDVKPVVEMNDPLPGQTWDQMQAGDVVEVRLEAENSDMLVAQVIVANLEEGVLTSTNDAEYKQAEGWRYYLIDRPQSLPTTLSEIKATLYSGEEIDLMGKGVLWTSATGRRVAPEEIRVYVLL